MAMWCELSVKQMQTSSGASSLVAHSSASQLFVELIGLLLAAPKNSLHDWWISVGPSPPQLD